MSLLNIVWRNEGRDITIKLPQIENTDIIKLEGLILMISYNDGTSEINDLNVDLEPADSYRFNVNAKENFVSIRVTTSNCPSVFDYIKSEEVSKS